MGTRLLMAAGCPPGAHVWDWEITYDDDGMASCVGVCQVCGTTDIAPQTADHP